MKNIIPDTTIFSIINNHIDRIKGGAGDLVDPRTLDFNEIAKGVREESEHTNDLDIALELVLDHLVKDPTYYTKHKNESIKKLKSLRENIMEDIEVSHPNMLEIPANKKFWELPISHYDELIKRKGKDAIIHALTNLQNWNVNTNPDISKKAQEIKGALANGK